MAYINLSIQTKLDRLNILNNDIGANCQIVIYDGFQPLTPDIPTMANAMVIFTGDSLGFGNTAVQTIVVGNSVSNVATLTSYLIMPEYSIGNGIASWARIYNANSSGIVDLDVGSIANTSNTSIIINNSSVISNIPCQIVSISISE